MEFLKNSAAFKPVPLGPPKEIYDHTDIAVTFDDGYLDILTQAAPILDKYAIPFTVFVTPELAEKGNPRYLNKTQIAEISKLDGCAIGAHGMTHCPLAACPQDKLEAELKDSKKWIEDAISKEVAAIAYPYGSVCAKTAREAERAGYQLGVCSKTGINAGGANLLALRRTEIFSRESMRMFYLKLAGFWDWHGLIR
jgi:peptidoglycan/xylan/chitin deacetylase (PgdA/CDA1 family)